MTIATAAMVGKSQSHEVPFFGSITAGVLDSSLVMVYSMVGLSNDDAGLQSVVRGHSALVAVYVGQAN